MKKRSTLSAILSLAAALALPPECGAQNSDTMLKFDSETGETIANVELGDVLRIPFDSEIPYFDDVAIIRLDGLALRPFYLRTHKEADTAGKPITVVELALRASWGDEAHDVYLSRSLPDTDRWPTRYPVAMGGYLVGMEVAEAGDAPIIMLMTIERNAPGREFVLEAGLSAIVDGLTVSFDEEVLETAIFEPGGPEISGAEYKLTLSDGEDTEQVSFTSYAFAERDYFSYFELGAYRVRILGCAGGLKMKVEKNSQWRGTETVVALNDSVSVRLREIPREEYYARAAAQPPSAPYTTEIAEAERMFGDRLPQIKKALAENYMRREFGDMLYDVVREENVVATDEELWRAYWVEYSFVAYYPELDILIMRNVAGGEYPINLNDVAQAYTDVGNLRYRFSAPDQRLRINGYTPGGAVDGVDWFVERWNEHKRKYEVIARDFTLSHMRLWYIVDMYWADNNTVLFERNSGGHPSDFTEMTIIEK